jgi:DNA-binding NarL/FixJ family response regulator
MTIRVLIADDHRMLRDALRTMLEKEPDVEVVGEAGDGRATLELARELQPDIVVLDIAMPDLNGVEASARLRARNPGVGVVALSAYSDKRFILEMLKAGASGYVVKAAAGTELLRAIRAVAKGQSYLCPEAASAVISDVTADSSTPSVAATRLGRREREVLQLLAEGERSPAIAARLHISVATVEAHRRNIMRKLNLHSVAELTKYAIREGLTGL